MRAKMELWYMALCGIWVVGHFVHLSVWGRVLCGLAYLLLSWLFYLSIKVNDLDRTDPLGVLYVLGPYGMFFLSLAITPSIPMIALIPIYFVWGWVSTSYAGHFAFEKKGGNELEILAVVVFPHVVVWEDFHLEELGKKVC
ncbi:hypothetical protein IW967_00495 [Alicyclobacillus mali]|uniref:Uncharacterized protein n=1 Tax=Alicyclobacillus mali (ex Roth et al. 2021) TaxID=1123961 RepID=A0ABS0EZA4_9BACL|nr:hypothetical protein [Alicyclobacillus mali (ex Roth et al. 2021)]MBF8376372.1 hypothetical protein [Alicyclobacillus mali (ex Roth et al. 2021)]